MPLKALSRLGFPVIVAFQSLVHFLPGQPVLLLGQMSALLLWLGVVISARSAGIYRVLFASVGGLFYTDLTVRLLRIL